MKLISNELFKAVRYALYAGATAAVGLTAAPVLAQDEGGQQLETITVTGSRIRKADVETAQPIVVLDRAAIEHQGFSSVADILQNLTEAGSPPISRSEVLASGEDVGGYYIDLRNLGNDRTLILLNGKRLGATTSGSQDLSQIPIAAIERMEVLKDGASAIYGSDAIAGVVNIITRSRFEGAEASAYVGQYDEDDGAKQTYSMTFGASSDRGSVTISAEYSKEDPVWANNRWFSKYGSTSFHPNDGWSVASQYGAFFFGYAGLDCPGMGDGPLRAACTLNPGADPYMIDEDGNRVINPDSFHGTNSAGGLQDLSNPNAQMMLQTALERKSLFASAEYAITDRVHFQTDILYNRRETLQQVAGYPFQPAFNYPDDPAFSGPAIGLSPDSYYNPSGELIYFYRRGWEMPRTTNSELTTFRVGGTFSGEFEIGDHVWNWDIGGYSNQNDLIKVQHGDFSLLSTALALGPSYFNDVTGRVECGTIDAPVPYGSSPGSCVPWNPFYGAGQVGDGSLTGNPELQAYLFPYYHDRGRTKTVDYSANLTGSVFTLPAGDLSIAMGYEYRKETGSFVPDAFSQAGISSNLSSGPTGGDYKVDEYYLEVDIPILKDIPFARELSVNVAGRYSDYSTFGDTTNAKFSLTWRPIDDLLVRGNYAEGFHAPPIAYLYGGLSGTFDYYTDPCDFGHQAGSNPEVAARCTSGFAGQNPVPNGYVQLGQGGAPCATFPCQTGIQFFSGSSPTLQPETATSKTAGLVYSPSWVQGLDVSVDWYRIKIENAMAGDSIGSILNDCYVLGVASRCSSSLFTRDASSGVVNYSLRGLKNAGWIETEGWDLGVNYRLPEFSFGRFVARWNTTYTTKYDIKADNDPATPVSPAVAWGSTFRVRSNASLDWTLGDFGATWTTRYYSPMRESCSYGPPECNTPNHWENGVVFDVNRLGSNTFHDVQFRYNAPWNATISVGANNVFDHWGSPAYSAPNSQYAYYGGFDIGRFYYLRYNQKF